LAKNYNNIYKVSLNSMCVRYLYEYVSHSKKASDDSNVKRLA